MSAKREKLQVDIKLEDGVIKGIPSSNGIVIARAYIVKKNVSNKGNNSDKKVIDNDILIAKFNIIIKNLSDDYQAILDSSLSGNSEVRQIIETYQLIINDQILIDNIINRIKDCNNIEKAVIEELESQKKLFSNTKDKIISERVDDLENIKMRILNELNKNDLNHSNSKDKIVVAESYTPSDLIKFSKAGAKGFISERGGIASHISILARSIGLPAIIDVKNATKIITGNQKLILDAYDGAIYTNPNLAQIEKYEQKIEEISQKKDKLGKLIDLPTQTIDGMQILLLSNIDRIKDVKSAIMNGSDGVGLVRTEMYLSEDAEIPNENIQYAWYKEISDLIYPKEATIRCFDMGTDKFTLNLPYKEDNPALGLRGIRYLLYDREIFKVQIRAILRASVNKNIKIMLPMISNLEELQQSKSIIEECKEELRKENIHFNENIPIGIMIETPASVLIAESLSKECNFFSIGTNDLTQYTLAIDRTNKLVNNKFNSFHLAVLKLISQTINIANENKISVSICGAFASEETAIELLIGMGLRELSVPPTISLEIKSKILKIDYNKSKELANSVLNAKDNNEVLNLLGLQPKSK